MTTTTRPTPLEAALEYASRGWPVFPCSPGTKIPFAKSGGSKDATTDETKIREWWTKSPRANVAIATGSVSGLYVVDVDAESSAIMPRLGDTFIARTRGGGWHYFYRMPEGMRLRNTNKKDPGALHPDCDTRGEGGYVLVFPSVVDGKGYELVNDIDPAPLPKWIVDALETKQIQHVPRQTFALVSTSWAQKALEDEVSAVAGQGQGGRNHRLNTAAFSLGQIVAGGHLSAGVVEGRLLTAALACGLPEREAAKTIASGLKGGAASPRGPSQTDALSILGRPDRLGGAEITVDGVEPEVLGLEEVASRSAVATRSDALEAEDQERWALLGRVRELGGLCDAFAAWVLRGADHPQPGLTLGALLALGSTLAARRLLYRRAQASLYVVALAGSGEGKQRPQSCLARVLDECWPATRGATSFSSAPAFVDGVKVATINGVGTCLVLDEYGMQLASMIGSRAAQHRQDLKHHLTELSTKGADKWSPSLSLTKGGGKLELWAPSVTICAATTPESLHSVLTSVEVADGFVGRHLWCRSQNVLPEWQPTETRGDDDMPIEVRAAIEAIRERHQDWHMGLAVVSDGDGIDTLRLYSPVEVRDDGEAGRLLTAHKLELDEDRRHGRRAEVPRATLARQPEFAVRVALALAVLAQPEADVPCVTAEIMRRAIEVAGESSATFAASLAAGRRPKWDDPEGQIEYVIGALHDLGGQGTRSEILARCRRLDARTIGDVLSRLVEEERAEVAQTQGARGRPGTVVRLIS